MQIIMVTPCYYPVKGGTETVVRNFAITLNKNNIQTDVMTFNMDQNRKPKWSGITEKIDGITVFRIPALDWIPVKHSNRITSGINFIPGRFIDKLKKYDIVHFHEFELSFPFFSIPVNKPKIIHLHGIDFEFLRRHHISRIILKNIAHLYISVSKKIKNELVTLGISKNRIICLPNSVDTDFFKPSQKQKEDNMLLFVGRITQGKGLHILIKSLEGVKEPVNLLIIGPPGWDVNYYYTILKLIKKENKKGRHRVKYLGAYNQTSLIEWYQRASIFILPSLYESFGLTLLEALACETPVIATLVGGIPEVIKSGENGILVPPNNPIKLAEAINSLLENKDVRVKFGKAGREWVTKNFSLDVSVRKLKGIYKAILNH